MAEPVIGDTRVIIQGNSKQNQIYWECPLCHECRWTEMRNKVARYPRCKHHKPTPQTEQAKLNDSIGLKKSYLDPIKWESHAMGQKKRYERQEEHDLQKQRINKFVELHPEYIESQRANSLERFSKPEELEKLSVAQTIRWSDPLQKEHSSVVHKALWDNPEFADKMLDCIAKGNTHKQTTHEKVMESILNEYFPDQWQYTGNRTVKIGRKYPDFTHNNGSNLLIECFGDYWHGQTRADKLRYDQTIQGRIELFAQYGYSTLVLWEHEILKSPRSQIADRVKQFMETK